jgi:hypothetical protein
MKEAGNIKVLFIAGFGPILREAAAVARSTARCSASASKRRQAVISILRL